MRVRLLGKSLVPYSYLSHDRRIFDVMMHGLEFRNDADGPVTLDSVVLSLEKGSDTLLTLPFAGERLAEKAGNSAGILNAAFQAPHIFDFLFSRGYTRHAPWAPGPALAPGECAAMTHLYLSVRDVVPTRLAVSVRAGGEETRRTFRLKVYEPKNRLVFPVPGRARCYNGPATAVGHHRQTTTQEFAYDIIPFGARGRVVRRKGERNRDFIGFGCPLVAPAPGRVVKVCDGMPDNAAPGELPGLSPDHLEKWGLLHAVAGNYLVIRHRHGECSFLAHCREGRIAVDEGDHVSRGQEVAKLGNTGNSTAPHLHYHLMDGENVLRSRSLPVTFDDVTDYVSPVDGFGEFHAAPDPTITTRPGEA